MFYLTLNWDLVIFDGIIPFIARYFTEIKVMPKSKKIEGRLDQLEFIRLAAYELRIPTEAILGSLEMLKAFPEKSAEYLPIMEKNARRLHQSIQDMVDPTKIANKFVIKKEKINLVNEITNLIKEFTVSANERNVKIKFVFDEEQTFYVYGHRFKLYQVFGNLIGYCLEFTKDGSIDISLARTIDKKAYATLSIHKTGLGIDSKILSRLFSKSSKSGSGLFIAKHILKVDRGTISAFNNADNKGATFVVTLPLANLHGPQDVSQATFQQKQERRL